MCSFVGGGGAVWFLSRKPCSFSHPAPGLIGGETVYKCLRVSRRHLLPLLNPFASLEGVHSTSREAPGLCQPSPRCQEAAVSSPGLADPGQADPGRSPQNPVRIQSATCCSSSEKQFSFFSAFICSERTPAHPTNIRSRRVGEALPASLGPATLRSPDVSPVCCLLSLSLCAPFRAWTLLR